jgi:tetratricopeptide (TPR) repeat protein
MKLILYSADNEQHIITVFGTSGTFGSAHDNTVIFDDPDSAPYHASIQYIEEKWIITDLAGRNDVVLNNEQITEGQVSVGDTLCIGNMKLKVVSLDVDHEEHVHVPVTVDETQVAELPKTVQCPGCGMAVNALAQYCPRCGSVLYGVSVQPTLPYRTPLSFILARMALICALCGPLLIGIGWLLGIILGLGVILRSRHISASRQDLKTAWKAVGISLCWVMLMAAGVGWYSWSSYTRNEIADNEAKVRKLLKQLAIAEYYVKYAEIFDSDGDMAGEYVSIPLLQQSGYHAFDKGLVSNNTYEGYRIIMHQADENEFVCQAIPMQYGITGKQTFWIDSDGLIYNRDIKGQRFNKPPDASVEHERESVLSQAGDELADDLYRAAKGMLANKNYRACERVTQSIRHLFPQSPAALRLDPLEKSTEPFLIEYKSRTLFADAQEKIDYGHDDAALRTMRDLVSLFPRSTFAATAEVYIIELAERCAWRDIELAKKLRNEDKLDKALSTLNNVYVKYPEAAADTTLTNLIAEYIDQNKRLQEQEAHALLARAREREAAGDYAGTLPLLLSVKNRFGDTQAAVGIDASIQQTSYALNEMNAEELIGQLLQQSPVSNAGVILTEIDLLKTKYINTEPYIEHSNMLVSLEQQCQAYVYIETAREQLSTQNYLSAMMNFELAVQEDPVAGVTIRDELGRCYRALGDEGFNKQDYSTAYDWYQKYLDLDPGNTLPNKGKLLDCYYHLSKTRIQNGQYTDAERFLLASAEKYEETPEYDFLYGKVLMHLGRWKDAFSRFRAVLNNAPGQSENTKLYATFCNYNQARKEEQELYNMISEIKLYTDCIKTYSINLPVAYSRQSRNKPQVPVAVGKLSRILLNMVGTYQKLEHAHGTNKEPYRARLKQLFHTMNSQCIECSVIINDEDERRDTVARQLDILFYRLHAVKDAIEEIKKETDIDEYDEFYNDLTKKLRALRQTREKLVSIMKEYTRRSQSGVSVIRELSNISGPEAIIIDDYKKFNKDLGYAFEFYKAPKKLEPFFRKLSDAYTCVPVLRSEVLPSSADNR